MKKLYYRIGIIFLITLIVSSLHAQTNLPIHRDYMELKNYLTKIWQLVQRFENPKANQLMVEVKVLMDEAEDYIYRRDDLPLQTRIIEARKRMAEAKIKGNLAAKIVLEQPVQRLKAQLDDLINQADVEVSKNYSDEARYLINQAKKFRRRAYDAISEGRIYKAQEFYQVAFYFANQTLEILKKDRGDIDAQVNDLKANLQLLIRQIEEMIGDEDKPVLANLLEEARKHYIQANRLYESGDKQNAITRFRLIEKLLYRILDQADRKSLTDKDRLENDLYSLKTFLNALQNESEIKNNTRSLLDKAFELFNEANQLFEAGMYKKAQLKISLSQRIATKVMQSMKRNEDSNVSDISTRLEDAGRLLIMQSHAVEELGTQAVQTMYREAKNLYDTAQKYYDENNNEAAFQYLQISTRLTNRIQNSLNSSSTDQKSIKSELENRLERGKALLSKLKDNPELNNNYKAIITQLEQFSMKAEEYLNKEEYELAEEYITSLLQQINLYANKWSNKTE